MKRSILVSILAIVVGFVVTSDLRAQQGRGRRNEAEARVQQSDGFSVRERQIVAEFYAIYGLALAKSQQCDEAVAIFQTIRSGVPEDEINVYNAEQGLIICQQSIGETPPDEVLETVEGEAP